MPGAARERIGGHPEISPRPAIWRPWRASTTCLCSSVTSSFARSAGGPTAAARGADHVVVIDGPSGSGKRALIRAAIRTDDPALPQRRDPVTGPAATPLLPTESIPILIPNPSRWARTQARRPPNERRPRRLLSPSTARHSRKSSGTHRLHGQRRCPRAEPTMDPLTSPPTAAGTAASWIAGPCRPGLAGR